MSSILSIFNRMSIKYKLVFIIMSACVISVTLCTVAFTTVGIINIKHDIRNDIKILAKVVGDKNAAAIAFKDLDIVNISLDVLTADKAINHACVYDNQGGVLVNNNFYHKGAIKCPEISKNKEEAFFSGNSLVVFHEIDRKNKKIGTIFLQYNLDKINAYIKKQIITAFTIIMSICMISYFLAMKLQKAICNPILDLLKDTRKITEKQDYTARAQKTYEDELGMIADTFNKVLEDRQNHQDKLLKESMELKFANRQSEEVLKYLDKELKFPFMASNSFNTMLKDEVFGPINPMYLRYFNDVLETDKELYNVVQQIINLCRVQTEIYKDDKSFIEVEEILDTLSHKYFSTCEYSNIEFTSKVEMLPKLLCYSRGVELLIDNVLAVSNLSCDNDKEYKVNLLVESSAKHNGRGLSVVAEFVIKNFEAEFSANDNFYEISWSELVNRLKNLDELVDLPGGNLIKFMDYNVRGKVHSINFLANLNDAEVRIKMSDSKIIFYMDFNLGDILEEQSVKFIQ